MHTDIVLKHDETHRWCLDCHDATNRDVLHLASGERVPFEESYRLCGQCHGEKYRDWRAGVHGRRTGNWNGSQGLPAVRPLPQSAPAAIPGAGAEARAAAAHPTYAVSQGAMAWNTTTRPANVTRRGFAAAAAGAAMDPDRLRSQAPVRSAEGAATTSIAETGAQATAEHLGSTIHVSDTRPDARRAVRLRAGYLALHRLPALRLRLRARRTTSRATRRSTGSACFPWRRRRASIFTHADPYYNPAGGPRGRPLLRARAVPAVRESALHQGLSHRRHVDREGRHRGHRLRLVHRLPLLHGGVPLWRAALQLERACDSRQTELNTNTHYLGNRPRPKGVVEKCTFCIQRTREGPLPGVRGGLPGGRAQVRQPSRYG